MPTLMRAAADILLGLAVFLSIAKLVAHPAQSAFPPWAAAPLGVQIDHVILAAVFSMIVAFNLAFYRHLRRVYASPRQGAWRRN